MTVINKIDLVHIEPCIEGKRVYLSAKTGAGVDLLRNELKRVAGWEQDTSGESVFLARERHLRALSIARDHLALAAQHAAQTDSQLDLFAEELRLAGNSIGEITGEVSADDLLGVIFSRFCIGKWIQPNRHTIAAIELRRTGMKRCCRSSSEDIQGRHHGSQFNAWHAARALPQLALHFRYPHSQHVEAATTRHRRRPAPMFGPRFWAP